MGRREGRGRGHGEKGGEREGPWGEGRGRGARSFNEPIYRRAYLKG